MTVVTFGSNLASLKAQRQLGKATADLRTVSERLASGLRINRASDDAAGLSIASSLNADRRVLDQGVRNLNDGLSLLDIAEGATNELGNILIRLKELAEQAANGTYGGKQRAALDDEAQALSNEYFRIAQSTSFNGQSLFSSGFGTLRVQGGYGEIGAIRGTLGGSVGTGQFGSVALVPGALAGTLSGSGALGDLNNDGILDFVGIGGSFLGRGDGTFELSSTFDFASEFVQLQDFNSDGILDVLRRLSGGISGIGIGRGDGSFQDEIAISSPISFGGYTIAAADFDGDGFLDIFQGDVGRHYVMFGTGSGNFEYRGGAESNAAIATGDYATADFNGDGLMDLLAGVLTGHVVYLSRGDGSFSTALSQATAEGITFGVATGDFNNDGMADIAAAAENGVVFTHLGRGDGTFGAVRSFVLAGGAADSVRVGDLNGDGFDDLVTSGSGPGIVSVLMSNGDGSFKAAVSYAMLSTFAESVHLGDLNNDGALDVLVTGDGGTDVRLALTTSGIGPLLNFSLNSRANALQAFNQFDGALKRLSAQRGTIGALQSRVSTAITNLQTSSENYASAISRISDVDYASEAASLARAKIIQFSSVAILAQANIQPGLVLRLLEDI